MMLICCAGSLLLTHIDFNDVVVAKLMYLMHLINKCDFFKFMIQFYSASVLNFGAGCKFSSAMMAHVDGHSPMKSLAEDHAAF